MAETNSETGKKIKELDEQKKLLVAQKALADAVREQEKALRTHGLDLVKAQVTALTGLLPNVQGKTPGNVEADKLEHIAHLLAYKALGQVAADITTALTAAGDLLSSAKVMIVSDRDFAPGDLPLMEIREQFQRFEPLFKMQKDRNEEIINQLAVKGAAVEFRALPVGMAPIALAALQAATDIAGYFKTDYKAVGYEFALDKEIKEALIITVAGKLCGKAEAVYLPGFYELDYQKNLPIIKTLVDLMTLSNDLQTSVKSLNEKKAAGGLDGELVKQIDKAITDSEALVKEFRDYAKAITTPEGQESPKLVKAALREKMYQLNFSHLLYLNVCLSGGQSITKKRLLRGGAIGYLGGAAACYVLADRHGTIMKADTLVRLYNSDCELSALGFGTSLKFSTPKSIPF